jgi:hypothetical protein
MTPDSLRQRIRDLDHRRRQLIEDALRPLPMVVGYLFQMRRRCGRPGCRCARGRLHLSWYLSRRAGGKTKLSYLGRIIPDWLAPRVRRYRDFQRGVVSIRKIDREISALFSKLREQKAQTLEDGP